MRNFYVYTHWTETEKGGPRNIWRKIGFAADSDEEMKHLSEELEKKAARLIANEIESLFIDIYSFGFTLDVGCGPNKRGHIGIDKDRFPKIDVQGNAIALPFKDGSFDCVVSNHLLEHIAKYGRALKEMTRVAKSGVIIIVPRKEHSYVHPDHVTHFTRDEWTKIIGQFLYVEDVFTIPQSNIYICDKQVEASDIPEVNYVRECNVEEVSGESMKKETETK